jgi:predicted  nucleic acid-binding Zn-ribbon protein
MIPTLANDPTRMEIPDMKKLILLAAVLSLAACDKSKPELDKTLVQMQQISAEKDSLLKDVMQTSQFIADVNTQLASVKSKNAGKPVKGAAAGAESSMTPAQERDAIKSKIKELTDRLNEAESRLGASRNRVKELTTNNAALTSQLAAYDSTIAAFKTIIDNQKTEIGSLNDQLAALQTENASLKQDKAQLTTEKTQLTEEKGSLTTERNTVYYIVGTKDDLLKKKIIEQTGGALGLGKTQVPARDLNPSDFTAIDKTKVSEIAFPNASKAYRIITRQDVGSLETAPDKSGRIKGGLKITNADKFWAASKFLIVIEQ